MNNKLERIYNYILCLEILESIGDSDKHLEKNKTALKTIKSIIEEEENNEYVEKHVLNPASSNEKCKYCGR